MAFENPRWEDYDYVRFHRNRLAFYGDGWTEVERNGGDPAAYMDRIDFPPIPSDDEDKTGSVVNGTINFGDAVATKDVPTVVSDTNGVNPIPSV